ncbi:MAG: hypothetical protein ACK4E3_09140 [Brevundimonas sp.]|jgi:hypothetical protein|uniref:hypothetical protein n=1 Tax=Brevundimonas sp. TaxID=1871086 RepID=UPI003919C0DE
MLKSSRTENDIIEIELIDGRFAYAQRLTDPLVGFYPGCYGQRQTVETFEGQTFRFCVWVHSDAFASARWNVVGTIEPPPNMQNPWFFKQDALSKKLTLYQHQTGKVRTLQVDELFGYEAAAVWDPEHIEQRLIDECEGRSNVFVESMKKRAAADWISRFGS